MRYYLGDGYRWADAMGPVSDNRVFDWRDALDRLKAAGPKRTLDKLAPEVEARPAPDPDPADHPHRPLGRAMDGGDPPPRAAVGARAGPRSALPADRAGAEVRAQGPAQGRAGRGLPAPVAPQGTPRLGSGRLQVPRWILAACLKSPPPRAPQRPRRRRRRVPSARRFAAGAVASFVAVFGVLALRVHDGDDPALASVKKATTGSTPTSTTTQSTETDPYDTSSDASDDGSSSIDDSGVGATARPAAPTPATPPAPSPPRPARARARHEPARRRTSR